MEETPKSKELAHSTARASAAMTKTIFSSFFIFAGAYGANAWTAGGGASPNLPPQSIFIDPRSFAVLGENGTFRQNAFNTTFNPTSMQPPFFQIFDKAFISILGPNASIREVASNPNFAFAHEAPIYNPPTDEVFFVSNDGSPLGHSGLNANNVVSKISLKDVDTAFAANQTNINITVTPLNLPQTVQMTNGGTGPYNSSLLFVNSGRGPRPPSMVLIEPTPPYNTVVLLDNFFGRQFNSLNDIKVHPNGKIFFTDTVYGYLYSFRPEPQLPSQVYIFDPMTSAVRVVATDFDKSNGIAFSGDGKTAYVTDTGAGLGMLGDNQTEPATIYAFDVDPLTHAFKNRRIFAYTDTGIPDGIQLDLNGNVFSGCGDGVQVWNKEGTLIGKFFLGTTSANMIFAGPGRLVILAETKIFVADISPSVKGNLPVL
ncbi:D-lactonohydrolase-like protein [Tricholoma matsutake]|nr:D-lactonohydrolase-like protein [Tricholoma matsutake 945]